MCIAFSSTDLPAIKSLIVSRRYICYYISWVSRVTSGYIISGYCIPHSGCREILPEHRHLYLGRPESLQQLEVPILLPLGVESQ